jgi:hypothetical protein
VFFLLIDQIARHDGTVSKRLQKDLQLCMVQDLIQYQKVILQP